MSSPEYKAKQKEYRWRAAESRRQAKSTVEWAQERIGDFTTQGEELLSQGVVLLGKTGSLGERRAEAPELMGVGSATTEELEKAAAEKEKELKKFGEGSLLVGAPGGIRDRTAEELEGYRRAQGLSKTQQIATPEGMLYATGSDLATLAATHTLLERDRRRMIRAGQESALAMLEAGEQYDVQANYMADAEAWNAFNTTLDLLMGGLGLASNLGAF